MNIAFIHPNIPGGEGTGATHSATQIIDAMVKKGHKLTVYCTSGLDDKTNKSTYDLRQLDVRRGKRHNFVEELNRAISENETELGEFDIVHSYLMRSVPAMGRLGNNTQTDPVVTLNAFGAICPRNDLLYMDSQSCSGGGLLKCSKCTVHGGAKRTLREQNSLLQSALRAGYRATRRLRNYRKIRHGYSNLNGISHFQALSPHVKEQYAEFGFPADRITVVPNMIDQHFDVPHRSDFTEPFDLLYVGTLQHRKGVDRLVGIARELRDRHDREFHLSIAGGGVMQAELEQRIREEKLSEFMTLIGYVPYKELPGLYAEHDIFLYPGRWDEPFGRVFLEAMCAGTPVFATDVGNVENIVGDCGRVETYSNTTAFTATLNSILDPGVLESYSRQTAAHLEQYHPDVVASKFTDLYEDL